MIWRLRYCNKEGVEARVDIIKGNRTPVEIVEGSGQPFTLSYKLDKNDKSGHIMTSSADIEIFETDTFNIDDLKTSNETELKVEYFEGNVLTWAGFILPDFFSIEIGSPNIVQMTASDRLTALKGITLSDLPAKVSLRSLIERCLAQTGLSLGLVPQIQIYQGSTDILESEILSQRLTDVRGRSISCYDILMSIMVGTNSTIRQRAGQWQVYNKLEHELRTPSIFFDKVEKGAVRTIQPVASSVGVYQEFGGNKIYPENYDFSDGLTGWTTVNGFVAGLNNKEVIGYTGGISNFVPVHGNNVETNSVINKNASFSTSSSPYLKSENVAISYPGNDSVDVTVEVNATGVGSFITNSFIEFSIIATNTETSKTLSLSNAGIFETMTDLPHIHRIKFPTVTSFFNASTGSLQVEGALIAGDENLGDYDIHVRIYGSGENRTSFINSTTIKFSVGGDSPKGNLYKTTQGSNFTKQHDIETVIFGDYIRGGINGHFYYYPIDDTSNLYLPNGELSSPIWKTIFDTTERPLLHHISRQKSRLFSVAHDILKANINVESFDPLAVFQDCKGRKYVVVSAIFDFLRSEVDVELEQIAYDDTILKRDYIYSYFGEGEDTIKSIGGISGGTGGTGGGGGMTSEQLEMLTNLADWWRLDEENDAIYSEKSVYSLKGVSALGLGLEGGGGGGDIYMLDDWANYTPAKANYYVPASLLVPFRNDALSRLTSLEAGGGAIDIEIVTTGSGNAITSLTKSGGVITATKGLSFALSTHNHTIAQITGLQGALDLKATPSDISTAISNIEIGGRNLLLGTAVWDQSSFINNEGSINGEVLTLVSPQQADLNLVYLQEGENVTFSIDVKIDTITSENKRIFLAQYYNDGIRENFTWIDVEPIEGDGIWQKRTISFTASQDGYFSMGLRTSNNTGDTISFRKAKLEKGNKPTDWSPAPEDQVSDWSTTDVTSFSYIKNKPTQLSQFIDNIGVATHIADKSNPHAVTTAQIGALPLTGGTLSGTLTISNSAFESKLRLVRTGSSYNTFMSFENTSGIINAGISGGEFIIGENEIDPQANRWITIAKTSVTAPTLSTHKVDFGNGFTIEPSGTELVFKYNGVIKQRMLSDGTILAAGGVTALATN